MANDPAADLSSGAFVVITRGSSKAQTGRSIRLGTTLTLDQIVLDCAVPIPILVSHQSGTWLVADGAAQLGCLIDHAPAVVGAAVGIECTIQMPGVECVFSSAGIERASQICYEIITRDSTLGILDQRAFRGRLDIELKRARDHHLHVAAVIVHARRDPDAIGHLIPCILEGCVAIASASSGPPIVGLVADTRAVFLLPSDLTMDATVLVTRVKAIGGCLASMLELDPGAGAAASLSLLQE